MTGGMTIAMVHACTRGLDSASCIRTEELHIAKREKTPFSFDGLDKSFRERVGSGKPCGFLPGIGAEGPQLDMLQRR